MNSEPSRKVIVIAGDVTIDWNLIFFESTQDTTTPWNTNNIPRACPQPQAFSTLPETPGAGGLHRDLIV